MNSYLYLMKINNLYGFIDSCGQIRIEHIYKDATEFSNGVAKVTTVNEKIV